MRKAATFDKKLCKFSSEEYQLFRKAKLRGEEKVFLLAPTISSMMRKYNRFLINAKMSGYFLCSQAPTINSMLHCFGKIQQMPEYIFLPGAAGCSRQKKDCYPSEFKCM